MKKYMIVVSTLLIFAVSAGMALGAPWMGSLNAGPGVRISAFPNGDFGA